MNMGNNSCSSIEAMRSSCPHSGVQRVLDARGQRGSWMPTNKKIICYRFISQKFLTFFSRLSQFYLNFYFTFKIHHQKLLTTFFLVLSPKFSFIPKFFGMPPLSWMPGTVHFFLFFQ